MSAPDPEIDRGDAGASVAAEGERRRRNRERRTRAAHPHIGRVLLALRGAPQHEIAFTQGAAAERAVADSLERRTADSGVILLHNRRKPGSRGDIDHIAIAPTGVYVIDTKGWQGKVRIRTPWFGPAKLFNHGRDRTKRIDGLDRQIAVVRATLDGAGRQHIPIHGALCFTQADLPWLRTQTFRGHLLIYRKALAKRLNADGSLTPADIDAVARQLAAALPRAG